MFSGFQEILVILAIVIVLLAMSRFRKVNLPSAGPAPGQHPRLPGTFRMAIVTSIAWVCGFAIYLWPWQSGLRLFLLLGIFPVIAAWSLFWVVAGFRQDNSK